MTEKEKLEWLRDSAMYKLLAEANFGAKCKEYDASCLTCNAHRLADSNLEAAIEHFTS